MVTNYHVLEAIAPGGRRKAGRFEGRLKTGVAVHFGHEVGPERPELRFPIRRVLAVGRVGDMEHQHPEASNLNFDGLDLAFLELEPVAGRSFPEPVRTARGNDPSTRGSLATSGRAVYLVGYPGSDKGTTPDLFELIFAGVKTFKRLAPGEIVLAPGAVPHDPRGWVMTHDASTLGGNSGSAVADLAANGRTVLGLHIAGWHARMNWAHAWERVSAEVDGLLPGMLR